MTKMPTLWNLMIFIASAAAVFGQNNCLIIKDSITAGSSAARYSNYQYDSRQKLVKIVYADSGSLTPAGFDTLFYNVSGQYVKLERYLILAGNPFLYHSVNLTYSSGKVARIEASGDNGSPWTLSYDLAYDTSGKLMSAILDTASVTGSGCRTNCIRRLF